MSELTNQNVIRPLVLHPRIVVIGPECPRCIEIQPANRLHAHTGARGSPPSPIVFAATPPRTPTRRLASHASPPSATCRTSPNGVAVRVTSASAATVSAWMNPGDFASDCQPRAHLPFQLETLVPLAELRRRHIPRRQACLRCGNANIRPRSRSPCVSCDSRGRRLDPEPVEGSGAVPDPPNYLQRRSNHQVVQNVWSRVTPNWLSARERTCATPPSSCRLCDTVL